MSSLAAISPGVCGLSVALAVGLTLVVAWRALRRAGPGALLVFARLVLPTTLIGLAVRLLAPWGPHVASGRDLGYIDPVALGEPLTHAHLMRWTYAWVTHLQDGLSGLVWGQLVLGALGCGLVGWLTYALCRRELPGLFAGLLASVLVVLARVDAGPTAEVTLRLFLLLALIMGLHYLRTRSALALGAAASACVALSYGRLEAPLLAGLILVWLASDLQTWRSIPGAQARLLPLGLLLCGVVLASLVSRWSLVPAAVAVVCLLLVQHRGKLARWEVLLAGACVALLLLPRALEILPLERETSSRFPGVFLLLFGRTNIFLLDPGLCTSLAVLLFALGLWRARHTEPRLMHLLACVGLPVFSLYLLFSGDGSARVKLQGIGILLLLPIAGRGAELVVEKLKARLGRRPLWIGLMAATIVGSSLLLGTSTLRTRTTLQQEYDFLLSLRAEPSGTSAIYAPRRSERETLLAIPRTLQRRSGIRVQTIDPDLDAVSYRSIAPGSLVFLGAGCRRFHDGMELPGLGITLTEAVMTSVEPSTLSLLLRAMVDKQGTIQEVFDSLAVGQWPICERLERELGLVPHRLETARRTRLEGRWMPPAIPFGLYRTTRVP